VRARRRSRVPPFRRTGPALVAFQIRNSPPASRIKSRHERSLPNTVKTGAVSRTINEISPSSTRRRISARPMPMRRALERCASGSLLVRIEMKIRLSMPSTTSMAMSVSNAAHATGSIRSCAISSGMRRVSILDVERESVSTDEIARGEHDAYLLHPAASGDIDPTAIRMPGMPARARATAPPG
jgi:hypothetical protein